MTIANKVDSSGNVYVSQFDFANHAQIKKCTSDGEFITKWGSYGKGDGQFNKPHGIAIDSSGNVYVADTGNNRIQKFTSGGKFDYEMGITWNRGRSIQRADWHRYRFFR